MRRDPTASSGHALLVSIVILVLVSVAAATIAVTLQMRTRLALQETRRVQLVALSDAALAEALAELDLNSGFLGSDPRPFGAGTIGSRVEGLGGKRVEVFATATLSGMKRIVRTEVRTSPAGPVVMTWELVPTARR